MKTKWFEKLESDKYLVLFVTNAAGKVPKSPSKHLDLSPQTQVEIA